MRINVEGNVMCRVMKCLSIRRLEMLQNGLHSRKTMLYMVRTWLIQIGKRSYSKNAIPLQPTDSIGLADVTGPVACCGLSKKFIRYELIHPDKLVCSGNVPCMACSIRGIPSSCVYPDSYVPRPHRLSCPASASTSPTQYQAVLQAQIDQTHGGHASFRNGSHSSIESPPSNVSEGPPPGTIQLGSETTVYVNSRHWTTRLVDFAEPDQRLLPDDARAVPTPRPQKDEIVQSSGPAPQQPTACALLLHGSHSSRSDILSSLPERAVANRLVDTYFNMEALPRGEHPYTPAHRHITSAPRVRLISFWVINVSGMIRPKPPLTWIALLYGIMSFAAQAQPGTPDQVHDPALPLPFLEQIVSCLVLGNYTHGAPYAIEALLHYFVLERRRARDTQADTWLVMGIILRLAQRMGYHRDPLHFPGITPFQGEMRRRVWVMIHGIDITTALQFGLPRMINPRHGDTSPPRNLSDHELREDMAVLPPSRPETEHTSVLHMVARNRFFVVLGAIADASMSASKMDPVEERRLLQRLYDARDAIPPGLRYTSLSDSMGDAASHNIHRIILMVLFYKGLIVLNWHHVRLVNVRTTREEPRPAAAPEETCRNSYRICTTAALKMLEIQHEVEEQRRPGGCLASLGLRFSAAYNHEFLMATLVLFTHVYGIANGAPGSYLDDGEKAEMHEMEGVLRRARRTWSLRSAHSNEAATVDKLLGKLFRILDGPAEDASMGQLDGVDWGFLAEFGLLSYLQDLSRHCIGR
ncbi:fungal specific transcription factor [Metarhizium guizhouense ARSEF 977]|uniref:Fungal specific transcription factor n=1 Tax=Metarhizium guizhouense (strain ARSEF 977) TaxID=1276136 RepID=A0A0B4GL81_METGA|nr:fungal specific transcription factor [Metarhizium guizhouense ARSEF 977]